MAGSPGISKDPATGPACAKEYSGSFVWDDDDYSSETTDSNPNVSVNSNSRLQYI